MKLKCILSALVLLISWSAMAQILDVGTYSEILETDRAKCFHTFVSVIRGTNDPLVIGAGGGYVVVGGVQAKVRAQKECAMAARLFNENPNRSFACIVTDYIGNYLHMTTGPTLEYASVRGFSCGSESACARASMACYSR
jgi:hypothetical protein